MEKTNRRVSEKICARRRPSFQMKHKHHLHCFLKISRKTTVCHPPSPSSSVRGCSRHLSPFVLNPYLIGTTRHQLDPNRSSAPISLSREARALKPSSLARKAGAESSLAVKLWRLVPKRRRFFAMVTRGKGETLGQCGHQLTKNRV